LLEWSTDNRRFFIIRKEDFLVKTGNLSLFDDCIGRENTLKLMLHFGGIELSIPVHKRGKTYCKLVAKLGETVAHQLMACFHGEKLYIPTNEQDQINAIHAEINARHQRGERIDDIALSVTKPSTRYTGRWIRKIIANHEQKAEQIALFPNY